MLLEAHYFYHILPKHIINTDLNNKYRWVQRLKIFNTVQVSIKRVENIWITQVFLKHRNNYGYFVNEVLNMNQID